jgi:hypothetical protein
MIEPQRAMQWVASLRRTHRSPMARFAIPALLVALMVCFSGP